MDERGVWSQLCLVDLGNTAVQILDHGTGGCVILSLPSPSGEGWRKMNRSVGTFPMKKMKRSARRPSSTACRAKDAGGGPRRQIISQPDRGGAAAQARSSPEDRRAPAYGNWRGGMQLLCAVEGLAWNALREIQSGLTPPKEC